MQVGVGVVGAVVLEHDLGVGCAGIGGEVDFLGVLPGPADKEGNGVFIPDLGPVLAVVDGDADVEVDGVFFLGAVLAGVIVESEEYFLMFAEVEYGGDEAFVLCAFVIAAVDGGAVGF